MPGLKDKDFPSALEPVLPRHNGDLLLWRKLHGSAAGLAIANAALTCDGPLVVVCNEAQHLHHVAAQLSFFLGDRADIPVYRFPDWECLPYDRFSPHPDIISQRLLTLYQLPLMKRGIVILPVTALVQRVAPQEYVTGTTFVLAQGDELEIDAFTRRLSDSGYYTVAQVMSPGEYAVRGGLVDVFPAGMDHPFRLDLFDNEIESIRYFDCDSQRSSENVSEIRMLPGREFPLDEQAVRRFRQAFRSQFEGDPQKCMMYREASMGLAPAGAEFYLPLFFDQTSSLFDYFDGNTTVIMEEGVLETAERLDAETLERYENALLDREWPPLPPAQLFLSSEELCQRLNELRRVQLVSLNLGNEGRVVDYDCARPTDFQINPHIEDPYRPFIDHLQRTGSRVLLTAESAGRRETLLGLLRSHGLTPQAIDSWQEFLDKPVPLAINVVELERGLNLPGPKIELITETQLYGEKVFQRRRRSARNKDPDSIIRSLAELKIDDPVVHDDHGVGRYGGLTTLSLDAGDNEFLVIVYHGGDKLYIPVLSLDIVSRYIGGSPETAPLHKLGSEIWLRARKRAREKAYDVAAELLEVQALRQSRTGYAFPEPDHSYDVFTGGFQFEETPDQQQVIDDVIGDMTTVKAMDRLVCGDVGFGKTEIAMRAAWMAISGLKQVVVLVPTTLLAQQHYHNFSDRFADWPVNIELFSRFRSSRELEKATAGLRDGTIDIAIGTHRLIQKDIELKRLGLLIIDEEHRFGVRQKERLKQLRSQVDILTLTATPIPRTLNFALSGLRDISVIATPPQARLSIKTFVREWNDGLVREACLREVRRGGQVYFLHNEVQGIEKMHAKLEELVPEARIAHAHGQMRERELESVMRDFYHQRFNILLCTTIIESGIDVPSANTIIINKADRFGLAQLHQLRGRVGRSHHQAYAYMISPPRKLLTSDAAKRLIAIEALDELGAGFALASQDLEIRGAGELLGESQSGMIDEVGYSLYSEFLAQAINSLGKDNGTSPVMSGQKLEIDLNIPARFPGDYIPDVHLRLSMYKRIAGANDYEEIQDLAAETIDRFGLLPDAARNLFRLAELKLQLVPLGFRSIDAGPRGCRISFTENPDIDMDAMIRLIAANPTEYAMRGPTTLQIIRDMETDTDRITALVEIADQLAM